MKVKKTLKLINNERLSLRAKAAKGCDSTSTDHCYSYDLAECTLFSTDICNKYDLKPCHENSIDMCLSNYDTTSCISNSQDYT